MGRKTIYPVFLPFSGCAVRCVFCAQDVQTGRTARPIRDVLSETQAGLAARRFNGGLPVELAFFGGTFTAFSEPDLTACLEAAEQWRALGLIDRLRCSTRPDALSPAILERLRKAGFTLVELGVQTFDDTSLCASRRGYSGSLAADACRMVVESGLELGIQLMPGLPGQGRDAFLADVARSLTLAPACVRLYPCLVLEGTALAAIWRSGGYAPWSLDMTVNSLTDAWLAFNRQRIPVIRMGLAEEPGLTENVLDGPRHPGLGDMVYGLALYRYICEEIASLAELPTAGGALPRWDIAVPKHCQGSFWGQRKSLVSAYAAVGIVPERVTWWERDDFALRLIAMGVK